MPLMPKRVKYRKHHRGKNRGIATRGAALVSGEYGLKALNNGILTNMQIESVRVTLSRKLSAGGKLWIKVFPHKSFTKKPLETRMGKGKGDLAGWVAVVQRGKVLFELGGIPEDYAKSIFRLVAYKIPIKTKFITRSHA
jgi:large subunit ribosomal protein L16